MKIKNVFIGLLVALASAASAIEYTVERFNPPIHFNAEGFKIESPEKEWTTAFLARRAPSQVTLNEFNSSISQTVKENYGMDEDQFESMVAQTPKDKPYETILAEVRFSQLEEDYLMLIIYPSELKEYPNSKAEADGFIAKLFFKRVDGNWISWMMPHDMNFDDPMTNIDYIEVLWPEQ